jgi:pimeloyl-ACP methyl ester carboxylesterase
MKEVRTQKVSVLGGLLDITVHIAGQGEPLVFLHAASGLQWDEFLDGLADHYTVYAPAYPGTDPDNPDAIQHITDMWDAVLAYDDVLDALGLDQVRVIGHSFGGMLACELAAHRRTKIDKLVLIAPIGLWSEEAPYTVPDWTALDPEDLVKVLFHRLDEPRVQQALAIPEDETEASLQIVQAIWTLGCTAKVIWPIPDKGLDRRIHRVSAPCLIIWGENDGLIPPFYAQEFHKALSESAVIMIPDCGHVPPLEQLDALNNVVVPFLTA